MEREREKERERKRERKIETGTRAGENGYEEETMRLSVWMSACSRCTLYSSSVFHRVHQRGVIIITIEPRVGSPWRVS